MSEPTAKIITLNFAHSMSRDPLLVKLRAACNKVLEEEGYAKSTKVGPKSHDGILFEHADNELHRVLIVHRECGIEDYAEADGFHHIDDWIDRTAMDFKDDPKYGDIAFARWWLFLFRLNHHLKAAFKPFTGSPKLFCTYEGERFQCTGCSRMGDVWLSRKAGDEVGYDLCADVTKITEWSDRWVYQADAPFRERLSRDVDKDYEEFWKAIICYPGGKTVDPHKMKCELSDYRWLLRAVGEVYCHITDDTVSKPNTLPSVVIQLANEWADKRGEEKFREMLAGEYDDDPEFNAFSIHESMDETNKADLQKWVDEGVLVGLVSEHNGGINAYVHHAHAEWLCDLLNLKMEAKTGSSARFESSMSFAAKLVARHWILAGVDTPEQLRMMKAVRDQDEKLYNAAKQAFGYMMAHEGELGIRFAARLESCQGWRIFSVDDCEWWIARDADSIRTSMIENGILDKESADNSDIEEIPAADYFVKRYISNEQADTLDPICSWSFIGKLEMEIRSGFDGPLCFASDQH